MLSSFFDAGIPAYRQAGTAGFLVTDETPLAPPDLIFCDYTKLYIRINSF